MPYDAFTVDTSTVIQEGINFEVGLLAQLNQFKEGPVQFVLSEIVVREMLKHLQAKGKKARDATISALTRATQLHLISTDAATAASDALEDSRALSRTKVAGFVEATGADVVPATLCTTDVLLKSYFESAAPFERTGDKKNEFPDALALLSLEQWARTNGKTILAVSADQGWKTFADTSEHIFVESDLAAALQVVQDHTEAAATAINEFLHRVVGGELDDAKASINEMLADALIEWDFDIEAASAFRWEVDTTELRFESFQLIEHGDAHGVTIVRLAADEIVVRVNIEITATAVAEFSLYIWDSVDREEVGMGSTSAASEETFQAAVLITLEGAIDGPLEQLSVENVEVVEGLDSVDLGEIELDYGDHEDDDYEQLQLMLIAEHEGEFNEEDGAALAISEP